MAYVVVSLVDEVDIFFFFQAEDGIRDFHVTGVQTCALPISALVTELAVEPLQLDRDPDPRYVAITMARLELVTVEARVAELKSRAQRVNPVADKTQYLALAAELFSLEQHARALRERVSGEL